jgi:putative ABC transport system permease protein
MLLIATSIGVMAVILLTAVGEGARDYITGEFKDMGTNLLIVLPGKNETTGGGTPADLAGVAPRDLTVEDAISLRQIEAIKRIAPIVVGETPAKSAGVPPPVVSFFPGRTISRLVPISLNSPVM